MICLLSLLFIEFDENTVSMGSDDDELVLDTFAYEKGQNSRNVIAC